MVSQGKLGENLEFLLSEKFAFAEKICRNTTFILCW